MEIVLNLISGLIGAIIGACCAIYAAQRSSKTISSMNLFVKQFDAEIVKAKDIMHKESKLRDIVNQNGDFEFIAAFTNLVLYYKCIIENCDKELVKTCKEDLLHILAVQEKLIQVDEKKYYDENIEVIKSFCKNNNLK